MEPGIKELQNLKNTCYINSVIQMLAQIEPIRDLIIEEIQYESIPETFE